MLKHSSVPQIYAPSVNPSNLTPALLVYKHGIPANSFLQMAITNISLHLSGMDQLLVGQKDSPIFYAEFDTVSGFHQGQHRYDS